MPRRSTRRTPILMLTALLLLVPVIVAFAQTTGTRQTRIASPPDEGTAADQASDNTTFSQDNRVVALMAYDTAATNLVPGDANGKRDVIVMKRSPGEGALTGQLERASVSNSNRQANGDSIKPSLDGEGTKRPHCVVFESTATNLDRKDRARDSDIYLRDLTRNRTSLISLRANNATNGVVDGACESVTYESRGKIYVRNLKLKKTALLGRGTNPDQQTNGKGVAYERRGQIYYQAYIEKFRSRKKGGPYVKKVGRAILASAGSAPGNGVSRNPSMDDSGFYVAFESRATNLCQGLCRGISEDRNGAVSDVFRRTLPKTTQKSAPPTSDRMQMVSFSNGVNEQGNGLSINPAMTGAGENIVFESEATNLRQSPHIRTIDPNGPVRDVFYWNFPRDRQTGNVSRESRPGAGSEDGGFYNGASTNPSASSRANYIGFTSTQTGLSGESNGDGIADVFIRFLGGGPPDSD